MHTTALDPESAALDVVCIPDAEWDAALWTNRQQMMSRLAARPGVRVLYVAPPRFALARWLRRSRLGRAPRGERDGLFTRRVGERLWVLQLPLPVPNGFARARAGRLLDGALVALTRRTLRRLGFRAPVLWSYTPLAERMRGRLGEGLVCYDVVDDYKSQPNYRALGPVVAAQDERLTRDADIVLTTSRRLLEERSLLNPNTHLLGNAADVELFATAREQADRRPAELAALTPPVIGFHGAIAAYKLDLALLAELARRRRDWQFVLVGPAVDEEAPAALEGEPNVHLLGRREPRELPALLAGFDVCLVPYQRTAYTERLSALKVRECLAAGRPVVATALPGFAELDGLIALADGADGFEAAIERALEAPPEPLPLDHPALTEFSWQAKADRALHAVREAIGA
jgi:glycosyltransferase involved in cell wall biosynthesis